MPSIRLFVPTCVTLLASVCATHPARAEYPAPAVYVGVHGGANIVIAPWDFGKNAYQDGLSPQDGVYGMGGLRVGYQVSPQFALELGGSVHPFSSNAAEGNLGLEYDVTGLYHFTDGNFAPYILVGAGGYHAISGDLTADFDPQVHAGLGLRGLLAPWVALRIEGRDVISDGFEGASNNVEIRGGLDFFFGGKPDKDKDGIVDDEDACPAVYGVSSAKGCPDKDGDTLADTTDTCPDEAGPVELGGCPDKDGDGIADKNDSCPNKAGPKDLGGCPDSDGDGIIDKEDSCPDVKGIGALKGCPDTDGDGLTDAEDSCPQVPGPRPTKGCPDRDHDGVVDGEDKCPDVTGLKQHQGCIPDAVKKFTGAIKGINFETASAKILTNSYTTLDNAVAVLKQFPELKLRIEGHTDSDGDDASNLKLSQDRANSVRDYMVSKGIETARLNPVGYGESKPVADNKTSKGKAANRRIEFTILGAE